MNRAEMRMAMRDHIMVNLLNQFVGEGIGDAYAQAVKEADQQLETAVKESVGG